MSIDWMIDRFGAPKISLTKSLPKIPSLNYSRWAEAGIETQVLSLPNKRILAFAVRVFNSGASYTYTSSPIRWNLGLSSYAEISESPVGQYRSGDAKFVAYVEHVYFGRWGHYNDFYFSSYQSGLEYGLPPNANRIDDKPMAVCVATSNIKSFLPELSSADWQQTMIDFVGLHGSRFEGL